MEFRTITETDAEDFYNMLCQLDGETEYMMYEPGERQIRRQDVEQLRASIEATNAGGDFLLAAVNDSGVIVGFISAQRGKMNRVQHTAYVVVGILLEYRRLGIGNEFFVRLDHWARASSVIRLELTVECINTAAVKLYKKHGFLIEGLRPKSMKLNDRFIDEYYMGKIM